MIDERYSSVSICVTVGLLSLLLRATKAANNCDALKVTDFGNDTLTAGCRLWMDVVPGYGAPVLYAHATTAEGGVLSTELYAGHVIKEIRLDKTVHVWSGCPDEPGDVVDTSLAGARFSFIEFIATNDRQAFYVLDSRKLKKVDVVADLVTHVAGNGKAATTVDVLLNNLGPALNATIGGAFQGFATKSGSVYFAVRVPDDKLSAILRYDSTSETVSLAVPLHTDGAHASAPYGPVMSIVPPPTSYGGEGDIMIQTGCDIFTGCPLFQFDLVKNTGGHETGIGVTNGIYPDSSLWADEARLSIVYGTALTPDARQLWIANSGKLLLVSWRDARSIPLPPLPAVSKNSSTACVRATPHPPPPTPLPTPRPPTTPLPTPQPLNTPIPETPLPATPLPETPQPTPGPATEVPSTPMPQTPSPTPLQTPKPQLDEAPALTRVPTFHPTTSSPPSTTKPQSNVTGTVPGDEKAVVTTPPPELPLNATNISESRTQSLSNTVETNSSGGEATLREGGSPPSHHSQATPSRDDNDESSPATIAIAVGIMLLVVVGVALAVVQGVKVYFARKEATAVAQGIAIFPRADNPAANQAPPANGNPPAAGNPFAGIPFPDPNRP